VASKCDHTDSRLKCSECDAAICTNCMTQCPVGFRCRNCIGGAAKSSSSGPSPWLVAKTLAICTAIGFAGGWAMLFIRVPFLCCIIAFMLGLVAGKWLAGILDRRLGEKVGVIVVFGLLIGLSLSPYNLIAPIAVEMIQAPLMGDVTHIIKDLNSFVGLIFSPVCFIVGVLRPSIWGLPF
jgi:hypothetical protein